MMSKRLMEDLHGIDPLPGTAEPPPLVDMLERLDFAARPPHSELHTRRRARAPRMAVAGAAIAGAGVVAAVALLDVGGGGLDVAQAILRATEPGAGVLHMSIVTERTVGSTTRTTSEQLWTAQSPRRMHTIDTDSEETLEGALTTTPVRALRWSSSQPTVVEQSFPGNVERAEESPVETIHKLIAEGRATVMGKTTYEGRAAWRLDIHPQPPPASVDGRQLPDPTLIVDAQSYAPLELVERYVTQENGKPELAEQRERYTAYEELPATSQNEALLQLAPHPGASVRNEE
jgi:hypothetical protein